MTGFEILEKLILGYPVPREFVDPDYPAFLQTMGGLRLTLVVTLVSLGVAFPFGAALAAMRSSRWALLRLLSLGVTEVIRGLPILLLVLLAIYLPFPALGVRLPGVVLATAAFTLAAAAYLGEILRSGFRAVDEGVLDAARVLGLSPWQILVGIRLPCAVRAMLPALFGLAITIFKDTSVLVLVAVPDMSWTAKQLTVAQPVDHLFVLFLLVVIYGGIASVGSAIVSRLEAFLRIEAPSKEISHAH